MQVTRVAIGKKKMVYVIVADKMLKYPWGRSPIAYVGTTKNGMARYAQSAAAKARDVLELHGVRTMDVQIVTCTPKPNVKSWIKLERAILFTFRRVYGAIPKCNKVGKGFRENDEFQYFNPRRVEKLLVTLAKRTKTL